METRSFRAFAMTPALLLLAGGLMVVLGALLAGYYLYAAWVALGQADRSGLFWLLPLLILGLGLVALGAGLVVLGVRAARGHAAARALAPKALAVLGIAAAVLIIGQTIQQRAAENQRQARESDQALLEQRRAAVRRIESIELAREIPPGSPPGPGLEIRVAVSGGLEGDYRQTLSIADPFGRRLLETAETLNLDADPLTLIHTIAWEALFAHCSARDSDFRAASCVPGHSVGDLLTISAALEPEAYDHGAVENPGHRDLLRSEAAVQVMLQTTTTDREIRIDALHAQGG